MPRVDKEWRERVKNILKAELARRNVSYKELADRLRAIGVKDTERNISNKISRGTFTAAFFFRPVLRRDRLPHAPSERGMTMEGLLALIEPPVAQSYEIYLGVQLDGQVRDGVLTRIVT